MRTRPTLLRGAAGALILVGTLTAGVPQATHAQDSLTVVERAWIGIQTDTARVLVPATGESILEIRVTGIQQGGPADLGGIHPGDVLVALNGRELVNYQAWIRSLGSLGPGRQANLKVNRRGMEVETVVVVAGQRPPSFPAMLDLPEFEAALANLRQEIEALMATFPDTLGPWPELQSTSWLSGGLRLDSGAVSLTLNDSTMTLDIRRTGSLRIDTGPALVPEEPGTSGLLGSADPDSTVETTAEESGPTGMIVADSTVFFRVGGDSLLADASATAAPPQSGELSGPGPRRAEIVGSVVLGGAQVRTLSGPLGRYFGVSSGVLIVDVLANSPARRAGFRPGDVILAVGDRELATLAHLRSELSFARPPVIVTVIRHGQRLDISYPAR